MKIAVIGKANLNQNEANNLRALGACLALINAEVITTKAAGVNTVVALGVSDIGVDVTIVTRDAFKDVDAGIIYGDDKLIERMTAAGVLPNKRIAVIPNEDELDNFTSKAVTRIYELGLDFP